MRYLNTADYLG